MNKFSFIDCIGLWMILLCVPIGLTFGMLIGLWIGMIGFGLCVTLNVYFTKKKVKSK